MNKANWQKKPGGGAGAKPRNYLSGNAEKDLQALRIKGTIRNPQTKAVSEVDETPAFTTYLTLALGNLSDIAGDDLTGKNDAETLEKAMRASPEKLHAAASFLWLFREDDPKGAYKAGEAEEKAVWIVRQLWELRNLFVHPEAGAARALTVTPEFYRFVEGELYGEAREHALGERRQSEKVFKARLFVPHDEAKTSYELTRKGIIFLVCLALYAHDAHEFLQQFADFKRAPRAWEIEDGLEAEPTAEEWTKLRKKGGGARAFHDAFTHYSMRAGRTDFDVTDANYLNFANILLYLNKVPLESYGRLALADEAEALAKAAAGSTESEENKRFKYLLQPRLKDRFLTLALAWIEDFRKLDCLRFKRLDTTVRPERKRYLYGRIPEGAKNEFGEEIHDANGMDRHYAIRDGVAPFEFVPEKHYGPIHIERLRGGIGENELMRLMLALCTGPSRRLRDPNEAVKEYLTAYHRILERMLGAKDLSELTLEDPLFREDFKTVSGKGEEALSPERFAEEMKPFFPAVLTRYFTGKDLKPDTAALQAALRQRFEALEGHARDFLKRLETLTAWRQLDAEQRGKKPPLCKVGELRYPPRTSAIGDAELIQTVVRYLNLNLDPEEKFRQLPRGKRHRGVRDVEFQLLHRDIGNFGTKPENLWKTLEKRASLNGEEGGPLAQLKEREGRLFQEEKKRCQGKLDRNGKKLQPRHTLTMLAAAAAELLAEDAGFLKEYWGGGLTEEKARYLPAICGRYGVRAGMELDRSALAKAILGIDPGTWANAYDYDAGAPREAARTLEGAPGLTAAQIPLPNGLAARCFPEGADGKGFDFHAAFRDFQPYERGKMALRRWYDVSPLVTFAKGRKALAPEQVPGLELRGGEEAEEGACGKRPPAEAADWGRAAVDKAIREIRKAENQDKLLLACAKEYWGEHLKQEAAPGAEKGPSSHLSEMADISEFFATPVRIPAGGVEIETMPNDFARPAYQSVVRHVRELVRSGANPDGAAPVGGNGNVYAFYDLWLALRDVQVREKRRRIAFIPAIVRFEQAVEPVPTFYPDKDLPKEEQEKDIVRQIAGHCREALRQKFRGKAPLSDAECSAVLVLRNRVFHPSKGGKDGGTLLGADFAAAGPVLRRFGFLKEDFSGGPPEDGPRGGAPPAPPASRPARPEAPAAPVAPQEKGASEKALLDALEGREDGIKALPEDERKAAESWLAQCRELFREAEGLDRLGVTAADAAIDLRPRAVALGGKCLSESNREAVWLLVRGRFGGGERKSPAHVPRAEPERRPASPKPVAPPERKTAPAESPLEQYAWLKLRGEGTEGMEVKEGDRQAVEGWLAECRALWDEAERMAAAGGDRKGSDFARLREKALALGGRFLSGPKKGEVSRMACERFDKSRPPAPAVTGEGQETPPEVPARWQDYPGYFDGKEEWSLLSAITKASSWEGPERAGMLAEARKAHAERYPESGKNADIAEANGLLLAACRTKAYCLGTGGGKNGRTRLEASMDEWRVPKGFRDLLRVKYERGLAANRRKREARRLLGTMSAEDVRKERPVADFPLERPAASGNPLAAAEDTPANSILRLSPSKRWTIVTDETGTLFGNEAFGAGAKGAGKSVFVLIPDGAELPPLPSGWHAVDEPLESLLEAGGALERSGCGVLGVPVKGLHPTNRRLWAANLETLLELALRLLPVDGPTEILLKVEQRGEFNAKNPDLLEQILDGAMHRLALDDPERAAGITIAGEFVAKRDDSRSGYADLVAFSWGCAAGTRKVFRRFGWEEGCLVPEDKGGVETFRRCLELVRRGGTLPAEDWNWLVQEKHAREAGSLAGALARKAGEAAKADPEAWRGYLGYLMAHLDSKAIDMRTLPQQLEWLEKYAPEEEKLPPRLRLLWLTARLATSNHQGGTAFGTEGHEREFAELSERLKEEDAPLACFAALHLAVEKTDRYEFAAARELVRPWAGENPAVPGLRMHARALSSLGQHEAFEGRNGAALAYFKQALEEFERLSERSEDEIAQTLSYAAIAAMDAGSPEFPALFSKMLHGGEPDAARDAEAIRRLAGSTDSRDKYVHAIALRRLAELPDGDPLRAAYAEGLAGGAREEDGPEGHPWELVEFYRGLLEGDAEKRLAHFRRGYGLAKDGGPTLKAISLVIGAGLLPAGEWPAGDYLAAVGEVAALLPAIGEERLAALRAQPGNPTPPLELAKRVLPFNFR